MQRVMATILDVDELLPTVTLSLDGSTMDEAEHGNRHGDPRPATGYVTVGLEFGTAGSTRYELRQFDAFAAEHDRLQPRHVGRLDKQ